MWLLLAVQGELVLVEVALISISYFYTASVTAVVLFTVASSVVSATANGGAVVLEAVHLDRRACVIM